MKPSFEGLGVVAVRGEFAGLSAGGGLPVVAREVARVSAILPDLRAPKPEPEAGGGGELAVEPTISREEFDVACREAYEAGLAAGRDEAEAHLGLAELDLRNALEAIERFRAGLVERTQRDLAALAVSVAHKIVRAELTARPEIWLEMIRAAVQESVDRERVRIRAPAALHRVLTAQLAALHGVLDGVRSLEVVEDPGLPEAGCVIESAHGEVDLGVETQVEAIRIALTEAP